MSSFRLIVVFLVMANIVVFSTIFLNLNFSVKAEELKKPINRQLAKAISPIPKPTISPPTPSPTPSPTPKPSPSPKYDPYPEKLKKTIENDMSEYPATYGVFVKNLSTNQEVTINPDESFTSASLYKLGVMYMIYKLADEGKVNLNNADVKNNLYAMITYSSNEAATALVSRYTSWKEITENLHEIGMESTFLDTDPLVTTPRDIAHLIELISNGQAVNMDASVAMLDLMVKQQKNDRIPVHLPPGVIVAHKTGELSDVRHDAGVVIGPKNNIILVLMSKDSRLPEQVKPVMQDIAKDVYQFFDEQE